MAALTPQANSSDQAKTLHTARRVVILLLLLAALLAAWGLLARHRAFTALRLAADQAAIPNVTLVTASAAPKAPEIVLPGTVNAYYEAPIYARTNGYVKKWYTDIGAHVKAGQILATLETPDVDDQLRQAQADLETAKANNTLAQSTARRWRILRQTNSVSAQDLSEKQGDADAKKAAVASAAANVARLREMQGFKNITAPFDGVVTARLTDVGALVTNGTNSVLFRVADTSRLRIYTNVPQSYVNAVTQNGVAGLTFTEYPGRIFQAKIVHTAEALDPASRSLLVELQIDNANGTLLPGGYTEVHFAGKTNSQHVRIPASALLFGTNGTQVATLAPRTQDDTAHDLARIRLVPVTIGRDFGTSLEITTGITTGQTIILNPPDSAIDNETVHIVPVAAGHAP